MKTQVFLAILPLMCTALADGDQNYDDICKATPPKSQTTVDGVKFKYSCGSGCDQANLVQITGQFDHPDDCAKEIASSSEELVTWVPWGSCWKCTAAGSGPVADDAIVVEKVKSSPFTPPPLTPAQQLAQCQSQLKKCKANSSGGGSGSGGSGGGSSGGSSGGGGSSSGPKCGNVYQYGGNDWDIMCGKISGGPQKEKKPGNSLQECVDLCVTKGKDCDSVAHFKNINQCMLFWGTPVKTSNNPNADGAVRK